MTTYTVTTLADENDIGATVNAPGGTGLSLREAVALANADIAFDGINFAAGLAGGTIYIGSGGVLALTGITTIDGDINGDHAPDIHISANSAANVSDAHSGIFVITSLNFFNTWLNGLVLSDATDGATPSDGVGAISVIRSKLTVAYSIFLNNSSATQAGAINTDGTNFDAFSSAFVGNHGVKGGAIYALGSAVSIDASYLADNEAGTGGAIAADQSALSLTNSTLVGNTATSPGAAVGGAVSATGYRMEITNSTITGNKVLSGGSDDSAGGIYAANTFQTITNSIVAGNDAGSGLDLYAVSDLTINQGLFGTAPVVTGTQSGTAIVLGAGNSFTLGDVFANVGINASTGVLSGIAANNGGLVQTVALNTAPTNPAIDAGTDSAAPTTDARSLLRSDVPGVAHNGSNISDLGAFEVNDPGSLVVTTLDDIAVDGKTSLREAIVYANNHPGADIITFAPELAGGTIYIGARGLMTISGELTINGDINGDHTPDIRISANSSANAQDANSGIFAVGSTSSPVAINGLTLTDAASTGILASDTLITVSDSAFLNNSVSAIGAYASSGGNYTQLDVVNSSFIDNRSTTGGGAIVADSVHVNVRSSFFSGNTAESGGAIAVSSFGNFGSQLLVENSTFVGNNATSIGGAIFLHFSTPATIINSTFTGNKSEGEGGAIEVLDYITLTNSIVAGNDAPSAPDIAAALGLSGGNILGSYYPYGGTDPIILGLNNSYTLADIFANVGVNPDTGVTSGLAFNNGGFFPTVALKASAANPAIDAGDDSLATVNDARGLPHFDFAGAAHNGANISDLGSFEVTQRAPTNIALSGSSVAENGANGVVVGSLSATDPDFGDSATFTLTDDAGGRFAISGSNLVVASGVLIDYEQDRSHTVTIRATDSTGLTFDKSFVIGVTDVPGLPSDDTFTAPAGLSQFEGGFGIDTVVLGFRLVDATVTYKGNAVVIDGPGGAHVALSGFERFVFTDGTVNNADSDRLVDDLFYYSRNHSAWTNHVDADADYQLLGWKEGYDPNAFFSTSTYLSANPDVKAAGANPLLHFDQLGWKEGRVPSINFDPAAYLSANPDVKAAGVDPLRHYLEFGYHEGRFPAAPPAFLAANGFDYVYYLNNNPDVAAAHIDPLQHFQTTGWKEGRNPNALFDTNGYLATYTDVTTNPLDHYNTFGWHEGRDPSVAFDTTSYLGAYPDIALAHVNPLTHFLAFGQHEGRSAFADGVWG